jgi:hypothetical protein
MIAECGNMHILTYDCANEKPFTAIEYLLHMCRQGIKNDAC